MKSVLFIYTLLVFFAVTMQCDGQVMQVFDVDAGGFPKIKAKLLMLDTSFHSVQPKKLAIYEDGIPRTITSTYCPAITPSAALSSILAIDVSGSVSSGLPQRNIEIVRSAAQFWINIQDFSKSECGLTLFDANSYIVRDFTKNKNLLLQSTNTFAVRSGTNHHNSLLSFPDGAIHAADRGKYKRVIVLITDGQSNIAADSAIAVAKDIGASIYGIGLRVALTDSIKKIVSETGGIYFENITSENEIIKSCRAIFAVANGQSICRIEWLSSAECEPMRQAEARDSLLGSNCSFSYIAPISRQTNLTISPAIVNIGWVNPWSYIDTSLEIRADNGDIFIRRIVFDNPFFLVLDNPAPFTLKSGETIRLRVRFYPTDALFALGNLKIESDACLQDYSPVVIGNESVYGGRNIKIIRPNGREKIFSGIDTVIQWKGTSPNEAVTLEFSSDSGANWERITDSATNYRFLWNTPNTLSDNCLIKAITPNNTERLSDTSFALPMDAWNIRYSRSGNLLAVAGYTSSGYGHIRIYNAKQNKRLPVGVPIDIPSEKISDVDISPDENYIAAFSRSTSSLFIIKIDDGTTEKYVLPSQISGYAGIRFTPDGKYIAAGRYVFDIQAKQFAVPFDSAENTGALSPDGKIMAVSLMAGERRLSLRDFANRSELCRTPQHSFGTSAPIYITSWSADAETVASATVNSNDVVIANTTCGLKSRIPAQINPVSNIALSPSGNMLAAVYYSDTIKLWNVENGILIRNIQKTIINNSGVKVDFTSLAFSPDGLELAVGGNGNINIIRLDDDSASDNNSWQPLISFNNKNNRRGIETHISPDGKQVLVLYEREQPSQPLSHGNLRMAEMWSVESLGIKFIIRDVSAICYGRSGKYILSAADFASHSLLTVYDARKGQPVGQALNIPGGKITAIDISPDDSLAAIARNDSVVLIRLGENPAIISVVPHKFNAPFRIVFIDDGAAIWLAENNGSQGRIFILRPNIPTWDISMQAVYQSQLIGGDASSDAMQYSIVMDNYSPIVEKIGKGTGFIAENNVANTKYSTDGRFLIFPYNGVFDTVINGKNIKATGARVYSRYGELIQTLADTNSEHPMIYASFSNYGRRIATLGYSQENNENNIVVWEGNPQNIDRSDTLFSIVKSNLEFRDASFGETPAGTSKDTIFTTTFSNGGNYPIYVSSISFDSPPDAEFSLVAGIPAEIPAYSSIPVELRFAPQKEGNYTAVAKFSTDIGDVHTVLHGSANLTAPITAKAIDFGSIKIGTIKDTSVESIINNIGNQDLIITRIILRGPDSLHFKLISNEQGFELKSGESHELMLRFAPEFIARTSARLEFTYEAINKPDKQYLAVIPLYGEGLCNTDISPGIRVNISEKILSSKIGEEVRVFVTAPQLFDASAIRIKYNSSTLLPIDYDAITLGADGFGYLTIPISNNYGGDTLVSVKFRLALGNTDSAIVTASGILLNTCELPILSDSGIILITDICRAGGSRLFDGTVGYVALAVSPNPIIGGIGEIAFRLIEKGYSKLEIVDRLGRPLRTIFDGEQEIGERQFKLRFDGIPDGSYMLILRTPNQIITLPIVVIN